MILAFLLAFQAAARPTPVVLEAPGGAREPQLAISSGRSRNVYAVFGTKAGVYVARSPSDAAGFERPSLVAQVGSLALGMRRGPRIAASPDRLLVTAIAGEQGGGRDGDLLAWTSEDAGEHWKKSATINPAPGSAREGLHATAIGPGSRVFAAWIDLATSSPRILGSLSTDTGDTWAKPVVLESDANAICPCCSPSVAFAEDGSIAVMWRNQSGGERNMVFARSMDRGATFSKAAKAGTGSWKIAACPMDGGALSPLGSNVTAVWRREDKVYKAIVPGQEVLLGTGEQPWAATSAAGTYFVWVKKRGGPLLLLGPGAETPVELDPVASDPVVVTASDGPDLALVAWESGDAEHPKIVVARVDAAAAPK